MRASTFSFCTALVLSFIFSPAPAFAQESRIAMQAIRCSAIFSVLDDAYTEDKVLAQQFHRSADIFSGLYTKELSEKTGTVIQEVGLKRREQVLHEFRQTFKDRQDQILEEAVLCGSWSEGFTMQGERVEYVPIIPKIIPQKIREIYAGYAATAFQRWMK